MQKLPDKLTQTFCNSVHDGNQGFLLLLGCFLGRSADGLLVKVHVAQILDGFVQLLVLFQGEGGADGVVDEGGQELAFDAVLDVLLVLVKLGVAG